MRIASSLVAQGSSLAGALATPYVTPGITGPGGDGFINSLRKPLRIPGYSSMGTYFHMQHSALVRRLLQPARRREGGLLLEAAVVLMVLATAGTAVLAGLSTTYRSGAVVEDQSEAENIARNQLESLVSQSYLAPPALYATVTAPAGYSVSVSNSEYIPGNANLSLITVSVSQGADLLVSVESLRSNQ